MRLETFELVDDLTVGGFMVVECGMRVVDVVDDNVEAWEDVMDRGQYWWENH